MPVSAGDLQLPRLLSAGSGSFLGSFLLKTNQVEIGEDRPGAPVARLREPRELFALSKEQPCPAQQAPRWPAECQVTFLLIHLLSYTIVLQSVLAFYVIYLTTDIVIMDVIIFGIHKILNNT